MEFDMDKGLLRSKKHPLAAASLIKEFPISKREGKYHSSHTIPFCSSKTNYFWHLGFNHR